MPVIATAVRQDLSSPLVVFAQSRSLSLKVSDEFTVPLCWGHTVANCTAPARKPTGIESRSQAQQPGASSGWKPAPYASAQMSYGKKPRTARAVGR
jgi:hypothetical protein